MSGTNLEIILKVKDEATAILSKVGSQAITAFTRAASAARSAFSAAKSMATFLADSFKVLEKLGQGIGKVFEILKKYAPDSAEYLADVTRKQELVIQNLVESINRLKAAGENLLITVFSAFGDDLVATLDSISVWVAKNKDDIAKFIVDVGKWLVEVFTQIGRFLGDMFRKIATAFGMDLRSSAEKELDSAIESMADAMIPLLMRKNMVGSALLFSAKDRTDLAYMSSELERLRDLKKEMSTKNMLSDVPVLPEFTASPTDKQMGVRRVVSEKETAAIEASKKSFEDLTARMNELRNSSVERTVEHYDKLLALQQGFIDLQAAKETEAGKALAAQIDKNLTRREQATEIANDDAESQATLDDIRLRKHLDDLTMIAKKMREEREKVQAELEAMVSSIVSSMSNSILNAFEAIVRGTATVAQAFGTMVSSILIDVGRMLAQKQLETFLTGLVGSLVGGATSGAGNGPGSSNFAARSAPGAGLAWGGPVQSGTNYVVGERGAEFFRSSSSGSVSAPSMTINVNGARDPMATALEIRNEVVRLATVDGSFRRRLQTV